MESEEHVTSCVRVCVPTAVHPSISILNINKDLPIKPNKRDCNDGKEKASAVLRVCVCACVCVCKCARHHYHWHFADTGFILCCCLCCLLTGLLND